MSNLSDLLPAGASAKQLTFTDSGSGIATKKPVILNSDGTVAEVSSSTATANVGSITTFNSDAATGVQQQQVLEAPTLLLMLTLELLVTVLLKSAQSVVLM